MYADHSPLFLNTQFQSIQVSGEASNVYFDVNYRHSLFELLITHPELILGISQSTSLMVIRFCLVYPY